MSDSAKLPALHPTRVDLALTELTVLQREAERNDETERIEVLSTARAALKVVMGIQERFGFTPTVADVVWGMRELMEAMSRLNRR